jgi:ankyrin repeat protein
MKVLLLLGAFLLVSNSGADQSRRASGDLKVEQAVLTAIRTRDTAHLAKILRLGFSPNTLLSGDAPIAVAARFANLEAIKLLLKAGASVNGRNRLGNPALELAAFAGSSPCVRYLLSRGAKVNAQDRFGMTALAMSNSETVAWDLIHAGANLEIADRDGLTPLGSACEAAHVRVVGTLLEAGANTQVLDKTGESLIIVVIQCSHRSWHHEALDLYGPILKMLRLYSVDPNTKDKEGHDAYYYLHRYHLEQFMGDLE